MPGEPQRPDRIARQRRTVVILASVLVVSGIVIVFFLRRVPPPLRILVGLTDFFAGLVLLVLVRQQFPRK